MTTDPSPPSFDDVPSTASGPVSADGISWKAAGAVLIVLLGLAVSWGATNSKLGTVLEVVQVMRQAQIEQGEWIAAAKVRLAHVEGDVERLTKRHGSLGP